MSRYYRDEILGLNEMIVDYEQVQGKIELMSRKTFLSHSMIFSSTGHLMMKPRRQNFKECCATLINNVMAINELMIIIIIILVAKDTSLKQQTLMS